MHLFDKPTLETIKNYISNHTETKDLKFEEKDLMTVYKYLQLKKEENNYTYKLVLKTKPYVHMVFQETIDTKRKDFKNNLEKTNILFNQNFQLNNKDLLKNIKFQNNNQEKIFNEIKKIIKMFPKVNKGFYLHGPFDTGKTFFLKILMKHLLEQKIAFLFVFMPDLTRQFRTTWYSEMMENKLNYLKKIPYLFIDDLGAENMTTIFRDDIFLPLLYFRQTNQLPTFFTSNLNLNDLYDHLTLNKDFNSDVKSLKIVRIIKKLTNIYDCTIT